MNLQNLSVAELSAQEVRETEGGIIPLLIIGACVILTGCAAKKAPAEESVRIRDCESLCDY